MPQRPTRRTAPPTALLALLLAAILAAALPGRAEAHPHIFVEAREAMLFDAAGRVTGVRHAWRFDDAFSAFATRGLDADHDGHLTKAELAPLAQVNMQALRGYGWFTSFFRNGERLPNGLPVDYWLEHDGTALTLHFTMPLRKPVDPAERPVRLDVFDPEFYVDFTLADAAPFAMQAQPAAAGAPAGRVPPACRFTVTRPAALDAGTAAALSAVPADEHDVPADLRAITGELANTMVVSCGSTPPPPAVVAGLPPFPGGGRSPMGAGGMTVTPALGLVDTARQGTAPGQDTLSSQDAALSDPPAAETTAAPRPGVGASPVGVGLAEGGGAPTGLFLVAARWQQAAYDRMTDAVRRMHADPSAASGAGLVLVLLSLAYGVFHAVGPGHGKAVISAYLVSNRGTARLAVVLSFLASLLQAGVAIAIVGVGALVLDLTSLGLTRAAAWMEVASYAGVTALGVLLVWRKIVRPLLGPGLGTLLPDLAARWAAEGMPAAAPSRFRAEATGPAASFGRMGGPMLRTAGGAAAAALPARTAAGFGQGSARAPGRWHLHGPACGCEGHAVAPDAVRPGWRGMLGAVLGSGLRPCTGALIVLVFTLAQGLFPLGMLSALAMGLGTGVTVAALACLALLAQGTAQRLLGRDGRLGAMLHRGIEAGAALVVLAAGVVLLGASLTQV